MLHLVFICLAIIAIALSVVLSVMCKRVKELENKLNECNEHLDDLFEQYTELLDEKEEYKRKYNDVNEEQLAEPIYNYIDIIQLAKAKNVSVDQICKELNILSDNEE